MNVKARIHILKNKHNMPIDQDILKKVYKIET